MNRREFFKQSLAFVVGTAVGWPVIAQGFLTPLPAQPKPGRTPETAMEPIIEYGELNCEPGSIIAVTTAQPEISGHFWVTEKEALQDGCIGECGWTDSQTGGGWKEQRYHLHGGWKVALVEPTGEADKTIRTYEPTQIVGEVTEHYERLSGKDEWRKVREVTEYFSKPIAL